MPTDIVYIDLQGKEVGRVKDDKNNYIVILNSKPVDGHKTNWPMAGMNFSPAPIYDMKSVDGLYRRSRADLADPKYVEDMNGNTRKDISVEHGSTNIIENGVVKSNKEKEVSGSPHMVIIEGQAGAGAFRLPYGGITVNPSGQHRGPSSTDKMNASAKSGYFDMIVDDKNYYFYTKDRTITVPKKI